MSNGQPRPHAEMMFLALEVLRLLAPYCARIAIAGSLRRGKELVGDIEIVAQGKRMELPTPESKLFRLIQDGLQWRCDQLRIDGVFEPRLNSNSNPQSWGEQQKWCRYRRRQPGAGDARGAGQQKW
jgi:hypothetical protein